MRSAVLLVIAAFALSGCVVRTYPLTKDRIDQDVSAGNRGYLKGQAPAPSEAKEKPTTRTTQVVEIELHSPIKFEKMKQKPIVQEETPPAEIMQEAPIIEGNKGYISGSSDMESTPVGLEKYKVQKGDTLQKISQKFYGTTKRWNKIYEANRDILSGPDKIYPGQTINVPVEPMKESKENLK